MASVKQLFVTFLLVFAACTGLYADHVVGSDILYKCLGNGKYEITFKFYRDCNGCNVAGGGGGGTGAQCPHPVLEVRGANGTCNGVAIGNVTINRVSITDITQLCGSTKSACAGGTFKYGIEEHLYKGVIDLSARIAQGCCKFKVSTTIFVRSTTISTGSANQGFYTDATIDACNNICNNSPEYTSYPVAIICAGQDFVFNNGAIDTTDVGDSLSYALSPAYQGAGTQVSYSGNFSPTRPLSFLGIPNVNLPLPAGFRLDSITGDLSFRPTKVNETGVIVIEVTEWRKINGVMTEIGRTRRDMQIIVVSCTDNKVPVIYPPYSATACSGQQICMDIKTFDADSTRDTVKIAWNRGIPRATFTNNNGAVRHASGQVCWTPTENDVSNTPYTFTITARDNACPLSGISVRAFSIFVREAPKATRTFTTLTCGNVAVKGVPFKSYPGGLEVEWRVRDSLEKTYFFGGALEDTIQMKPGRNVITLILKTKTPCVNAFADTVYIDPYVQVDLPNDTLLCEGSSLQINSTTTLGKPAYHYQWNTSTADTGTSLLVTTTTDSVFRITVSDGEGCQNTDSMKLLFGKKPLISLDTGKRICFNDIVELDAGNDTFSPAYTYLWNTNDTSRKLLVNDSNTYIARVTDSIGCTNRDTFRLYVNEVPLSAGPDKQVCYNDTAILTASGTQNYQWSKLPNPAVVSGFPVMQEILTVPATYRVTGSITYDGLTCENDDTVEVTINPLPTITFSSIPDKCENAPPFDLSVGLAFPTLTFGEWTSIDDPDYVQFNQFYPDSVTVTSSNGFQVVPLKYSVTDANGCENAATTTMRVIKLPVVNVKDTSICADKGKVSLISLVLPPSNTIPGVWKWSSQNTSANDAIENNGSNALFNMGAVPQNQTYQMCLEITNLLGCPNTSCQNTTVRPVPLVDAGFLKAVCQNDTAFNMANSGASPAGGIWQSASGGLINGNTWFNPNLVLADTHRIYYTYDIPGNNCPVTDNLLLRVWAPPSLGIMPPGDVCTDSGIINLMGNANPIGGTWTGQGIAPNGDFNPAPLDGVINLRYDYKDLQGCKNFITTTIKVDKAPSMRLDIPSATCQGFPVSLTSGYTNAAGIQWGTSGTGTFTPPADTVTQYQPAASDSCFIISLTTFGSGVCKAASQNINVCMYPTPTAGILADRLDGCEPHTVNFEAVTDLPDNAVYAWDFGDAASGNNNISGNRKPSHTFQNNGTYPVVLKVTTKYNCTNTSQPVDITVHPLPVANMDASHWLTSIVQTKINFFDRTTIDAPDNITSYLWKFGDADSTLSTEQNPTFEYSTDSGVYYVSLRVVSNNNCESVIGRYLVINPELTVFIPNAFIPDGEGEFKNERFWVTADGFSSFHVDIFSRWGELVYTSNDISHGWDGKFKGVDVQQDVFFYVITLTGYDGQEYRYKGSLTLLR